MYRKLRSRFGRVFGRASLVAAIGLLCAFGPPEGGTPDVSRLGRFVITKTSYPPEILARVRAVDEATRLTAVLLAQSDIKQIRAYREFLGKASGLPSAEAQLEAVNDYVNERVLFVDDATLYLGADVWAPPITTLMMGGDCEDLALLKSWGLERLGFSRQNLFLMVGVTANTNPPVGHAVLAVRLQGGDFVLLDNTEQRVLTVSESKRFEPIYAVNTFGYWDVDDPSRSRDEVWKQALQVARGPGDR